MARRWCTVQFCFGMLIASLGTMAAESAQAQSSQAPAQEHAALGPGEPAAGLASFPPEPDPEKHRRRQPLNGRDYLGLAAAPPFLPRSYLYWGTPVGPDFARAKLAFGLEYALNLPFYNDLARKAREGKAWAGALTLTFQGALRMIRAQSEPVPMPSYLPSLAGQLFYVRYGARPTVLGLQAGVFHYSNGQQGCTFDARLRSETWECRVANTIVVDPQRQLNRENGDFNTSGWLLALNGRLHRLDSQDYAASHLSFSLSAWANGKRTAFSMYPELRKLFGWGRLAFELEGWHRVRRMSFTARGGVDGFPKTDPRIPKVSGHVELQMDPYWASGIGLFVRYFGGRDFYNAFFVDRIQQFAMGLVWQLEQRLKFKRDER